MPVKLSKGLQRLAGGIDVTEDVRKVLPGLGGILGHYKPSVIAYSAYVFEYIASITGDSAAKKFSNQLAEEYAKRFAEWLGYVFMNRANLTRKSKAIKDVEAGLGKWVESIPEILGGSAKEDISAYVPDESKFLNFDVLNKIGDKILYVVDKDWRGEGGKLAAGIDQLPIQWNRQRKQYEIPGGSMSYKFRRQLRDLGFDWQRYLKIWYTDTLDSEILRKLPQAGMLERGAAPAPVEPSKPIREWFFEDWLPSNISRFSKVFNTYGRTEGVPYTFKFTVSGDEVTVDFRRNIETLPEAIAELRARYGKGKDRDGWMLAIASYDSLLRASGKAAMHAVDMANNLEHTHGAMMEHFPPGVRKWYPRFLDFKYTADILQMTKNIEDEDIRTIAETLLPHQDQMRRLNTPKVDHRTPKGLALEISSQPGKANKRKMLRQVEKEHPDLFDEVVENLAEKGLKLAMSKNPLRKAIVKLAKEKPELRKHLVPLLTKQASVASTILKQMGGMGRIKAMAGAYDFTDHSNGVSFKFKAGRKANYVKITLDSDDTYTMEIGKIRGLNYRKLYKESGLYWDMLKSEFESNTGLYLSL